MLLVALAVFFGACYILYLRTLQSKLVLFGEAAPAFPRERAPDFEPYLLSLPGTSPRAFLDKVGSWAIRSRNWPPLSSGQVAPWSSFPPTQGMRRGLKGSLGTF